MLGISVNTDPVRPGHKNTRIVGFELRTNDTLGNHTKWKISKCCVLTHKVKVYLCFGVKKKHPLLADANHTWGGAATLADLLGQENVGAK